MFSVIIPAYNAEKFIETSVNSVLSQTYRDFELIIVDDGSKDGTSKKIAEYNDDRIKYVYQENGGVSSARNKGICASKGEFVCFLDSDDEWKENHLETLNDLIEKYENCGMYITGYDIRLHTGMIVHKSEQIFRHLDSEDMRSEDGFAVLLKYGYFFNTNTVCCRREVFEKVGLFEFGVKNGEDDDMWFRIFSYYAIAISKKVTTVYDRSNCGATGRRGDVQECVFMGRIDGLLNSEEVAQYRKDSILIWVERHKLSQARKYILNGNKSEARKLLRTVDFQKSDKKKYLETKICMLIPSRLIRKHIDLRDAGYYQ
jgi:glycosyltransferase involved in cell wall biosynthesis